MYSSNPIYKSYRKLADYIDWQSYNVNDLFRECIKHEGDSLYENFFAGIMCRFFGYAGRIYLQCERHVPFEDCHSCVVDAARYVLNKRVWENPTSSLYNDNAAPDKAMHIAMKREKAIMLSKLSAKRRLSNFDNLSIDRMHEDYSDSADGLLFELNDTYDVMYSVISEYFSSSKNDYFSGIVIDTICYNCKPNTNISVIVRELRKLDISSLKYFIDTYNAKEDLLKDAFVYIRKTPNNILEMKIKALLYLIRKDYENE